MQYYYWLIIGILFLLNGCYAVGYQDFVNYKNDRIGQKPYFTKPFKYDNAGKLRRGNFVISGQGFTHITRDKNGNLIHHFSEQEILSNYGKKEWIGKCLTYYVVDQKTHIIKSWGFDKGGNPLSCRTWP